MASGQDVDEATGVGGLQPDTVLMQSGALLRVSGPGCQVRNEFNVSYKSIFLFLYVQ